MADIARFVSVDPLAEDYGHLTTYQYASNDPIVNIDIDGLEGKSTQTGDTKKQETNKVARGVQGVATSTSVTTIQSERVRNQYKKTVSSLDPTDSKGRTKAKTQARAKTPALTRTIAETIRPISKESSRTGGTASKTNPKVNNTVKNLAKGGKILGVGSIAFSAYNIAVAEDKSKAVASETGALAGAIAGGETGAAIGAGIGAFFGGGGAIPGAIVGAIIGSVAGAIGGAYAGEEVHDVIEDAITN